MHRYTVASIFGLLLLYAGSSLAERAGVTLPVPYPLIEKLLADQLYRGNDRTAELWKDKHGCSYLTLSNPKIDAVNGQVRLLNNVDTRLGTRLGGQCLTILEWAGRLETQQRPELDAEHGSLSFPITAATAYDGQGRRLMIGKLQDLLKRVAEPKLGAIKIDLNKVRRDIETTLTRALPKANTGKLARTIQSLTFDDIKAEQNGIVLKLGFNVPSEAIRTGSSGALSEEEQRQWRSAWREWKRILRKAIDRAAEETGKPQLREDLLTLLANAGTAFEAGLQEHTPDIDPVKLFFTEAWPRVAEVLKSVANELPGGQGLRYLSFISAADTIAQLENLGFTISSDSLRTLARLLITEKHNNKHRE